jgi:hypothetical protein
MKYVMSWGLPFIQPQFTSLHFTSLHFSSLHLTSLHWLFDDFPPLNFALFITFLTLFLKLLGLQERVPKTSAGSWFQSWMVLQDTVIQEDICQNGICERSLEKAERATHILCECEALAYLIFHHLGHYFMEAENYNDAHISRILHFLWKHKTIMTPI